MAPWAQALVAFAVAGLLTALGPERCAEWGWRVLFLLGAACSLGMLGHYRTRVADAPLFHRRRRSSAAAGAGTGEVLVGRWAGAFWQVFTMMTGLWLLTDTTVLILTTSLSTDAGRPAARVSLAMGAASVAQALSMTPAGHLSTRTGRRALLVGWGIVAAVLGPVLWRTTVFSRGLGRAAALAGLLQVATVAAYGPVSAYLSERFPTRVRSTGYGMGYSLSLVLPALYTFYTFYLPAAYLPAARGDLRARRPGGALLAVGVLLGPALGPGRIDDDLDTVADASRGQDVP